MKKMVSLVLVAFLLGGCVQYKDGKPVETASSEEKPKEEVKKEESKKEEPQADQQATTDLQTYFEENFNMTSWYELIQGYEIVEDEVTIRTTATDDEEGRKSVEGILSTVWGYTNTNDSKYDFKKVNILGEGDVLIFSKKNPLD